MDIYWLIRSVGVWLWENVIRTDMCEESISPRISYVSASKWASTQTITGHREVCVREEFAETSVFFVESPRLTALETIRFLTQNPTEEKWRLVSIEAETSLFWTYCLQVTITDRNNTVLNSALWRRWSSFINVGEWDEPVNTKTEQKGCCGQLQGPTERNE